MEINQSYCFNPIPSLHNKYACFLTIYIVNKADEQETSYFTFLYMSMIIDKQWHKNMKVKKDELVKKRDLSLNLLFFVDFLLNFGFFRSLCSNQLAS